MRITFKNGVTVEGDVRINLDPKRLSSLSFISHAHTDHIPSAGLGEAVCSEETAHFIRMRKPMDLRTVHPEWARLFDAGHMVGSRMIRLDGEKRLLYTGDFNVRDRFFLRGAKPQSCDILVLDGTFSSPEYRFPKTDEIISQVKSFVEESGSAVFFGYAYGKAQILTALANQLGFVPIVHGSVFLANRATESFGIELGDYVPYGGEKSRQMMKEDHLIIAPPHLAGSPFSEKIRAGGASTALFSGWAGRREGAVGFDGRFPLSDHCDEAELLDFVEKCSPEEIIILNNSDPAFVSELRKRGFGVRPTKGGRTLLDFR